MADWLCLKRSLEPAFNRVVTEFPALVLTRPRKSGKTTWFKNLFGETHG